MKKLKLKNPVRTVSATVPRAATITAGRQFAPAQHLFKFGKKKYLQQTLSHGIIRIAPASYYSDSSLNYAIKDDELSFSFETPGGGVTIQKVDRMTLKPIGERIPITSNVEWTQRNPTDYLIFCLSLGHVLRAYDDFEADSCLVINDTKGFFKRLSEAVRIKRPDFLSIVGAVQYLDPLNILAIFMI